MEDAFEHFDAVADAVHLFACEVFGVEGGVETLLDGID